MLFEIDPAYKWVLLVSVVIGFQVLVTGFIVGDKRRKIFKPEFMEQNFRLQHEEYFPGEQPNKEGYPDMGNGRYSAKLTYKDWFEFNSAQRIHYNYLESVA